MTRDLIDFLMTDLRKRPAMFLTTRSLSNLDTFLTGIQVASWDLDESKKYTERFFGENGFLEWSWAKYNLGRPSCRLVHYLDLADGNEKLALDLLFNDLEKYSTLNKG